MKTKRKIITLLVVSMTMTYNIALGQISQGGVPYGIQSTQKKSTGTIATLSEDVPTIQMPQVSQSAIDSIKEENKKGVEVFQFAYRFNVNINLKDTSVVDSLESGLLYRFSVKSSGAKSINIIFKEYNVPLGSKLFLYNSDQTITKGAFTSNNNKSSNKLPIEPIAGDEIIIEYFEPYFSSFKANLIIGKVNHDFLGIVREDGNFGNSGSCQVDINCTEGDNWQSEKRAVCRIVINGSGLCSGALLNNTSSDGTPYFLTANHCIDNQSDAENSVFVFNYESPTCNGSDGSVAQSISGADLRATRQGSDFTLLELSKTPISTYNPYYAGWNRNDNQGAGGVGIHHPAGDVKKISTFNMSPINSNCISGFPQNNFYLIDNWVSTANGHGVTEGGSSGSPLFNNNHQVIGQLFGGCPGHNDDCSNPSNDFSNYGKIFSSWDLGTNSGSRLRDWLDPNNSITALNGAGICSEGTALNLNITHTITANSVELHQAINRIEASNIIESGATATYEAGNEIVLKPGFHAEAGSNFTAQIVPLNCVEGCYPMNLTAWTSFVCGGDDLCFNITNSDSYSVSVFDAGGSLVHQSSGPVTGNSVCVWNTSGVATAIYSATVSFSNECEEISNSYQLLVASCKKSANDTSSASSNENSAEKISSISEKNSPNFNMNVFPNPSDGNFSISLVEATPKPYSFQIINSLGSVIYEMEHVNVTRINVNQSSFPSGIYYIKLMRGTDIAIKKLVIQ